MIESGAPAEGTRRLALPAGDTPWRAPLFGSLAEVLSRVADSCLHPLVVLPLFFAAFAGTNKGIGAAVATILAAAYLASGFESAAVLPRHPAARLAALLAATGLGALALLILAGVSRSFAATGIPLTLLTLAALGAGFATPLRVELAGIVRPTGSWRTRWGRWMAVGILGAVVGAVLARGPLRRTVEPFPAGFTQLFLIAGLALLTATAAAGAIGKSAPPAAPARGRAGLSVLPDLLANNLAFGRFVFFRVLYACGALADPFFILYATRELGAGGRTAGAYLLALTVARAVAMLLWRGLSRVGGNPMVLQLAAFVRLLAPITALTLPPLLGSATLRDRLPGGNATNLVAFGLVFVAAGVASAGLDLAAPAIQAGITTPSERASAGVVTGLMLAAATLALPLGGIIVDHLGYSFLFIVAMVAGLVALIAGGLIDDPAAVVVRAAPSDHLPYRRSRAHREG